MLVAQLNIPIRQIDEVFPEVVRRRGKRDLDKRAPLGPFRFADQAHVRFTRKHIAFALITLDARANDVFPCRGPSPVAWHDMIEIEVTSIESLTAVLASVLVALEHVMTCKLYFLLREPIENQQHNHPRDTN